MVFIRLRKEKNNHRTRFMYWNNAGVREKNHECWEIMKNNAYSYRGPKIPERCRVYKDLGREEEWLERKLEGYE